MVCFEAGNRQVIQVVLHVVVVAGGVANDVAGSAGVVAGSEGGVSGCGCFWWCCRRWLLQVVVVAGGVAGGGCWRWCCMW